MEFHLNDLSLNGQFSNANEFYSVLDPLLKLRHTNNLFSERFFCSASFGDCLVFGTTNLKTLIRSNSNKNKKSILLNWLDRSGPFTESVRVKVEDDYFECNGVDVTDKVLGEVARRILDHRTIRTYSFLKSSPPHDCNSIEVQHGLKEDILELVPVTNFLEISEIEVALEQLILEPKDWKSLVENVNNKYTELIFSTDIINQLKGQPFCKAVGERICCILDVLNGIVTETLPNGSLSEKGSNLKDIHFNKAGGNFSDESASNKRAFKNQLTFRDPDDSNKHLKAFWHGKINTRNFRIHFEWPRPNNQKFIKVLYIGPKITRK